MFWVCVVRVGERHAVPSSKPHQKECHTQEKENIWTHCCWTWGEKAHYDAWWCIPKNSTFCWIITHVFECVFSGSVILRFHKWPYSHKISNQANTHFYRPCQSLKSCRNAQETLKRHIAVEKKQHRIRAVKQAKVLYTPHIIQMNWDTKAWVFYQAKHRENYFMNQKEGKWNFG